MHTLDPQRSPDITPPPIAPEPSLEPVHEPEPFNPNLYADIDELSRDDGVSIGGIVRDVAIIFGLTVLGGYLLGVSKPYGRIPDHTIALTNLGMATVGFTIAGCLAPTGYRWAHLRAVALGLWLVSSVNIFLGIATPAQWALGSIFVAILMAVGGGLSYFFKADPLPPI